MKATNSGEMVMGETRVPATNKPWKLAALEIQRFEGGKEKEAWIFEGVQGAGRAMPSSRARTSRVCSR